jgi:hypothetical protein
MKSFFFTFLIIAVPALLCAQQTIEPRVSNSVGIDAKLNDIFITASIGEPAIITLGTAQGYVTQGFLQPELLPCGELEFKYYPNPTKDIVTVEVTGCDVGIRSIEVVDIWGRILAKITSPKNNQVSLGDYAQGVYLLKVKLTNDDIQAISIVKSSE